MQQIAFTARYVRAHEEGQKVAAEGRKEEIDEEHGTQQSQNPSVVFEIRKAVRHIAEGGAQGQTLLRRVVRADNQQLGYAGNDKAAADAVEQSVYRQDGVQNARHHDAEDILQRTLHGQEGIGLLQMLFLHDVGNEGIRGGEKQSADDVADDSQREQNGNLRRALLKQHQPRWVLVELGGNDGLRGFQPQQTEQTLRQILQDVKAANAEPLLMQIRLPANYGRRYNEAFSAIYPKLAKEFDVPLLPFFMEEVYLKPQWMQDDGIHPNRDAQPFIADWMAKQLQPLVNHDS